MMLYAGENGAVGWPVRDLTHTRTDRWDKPSGGRRLGIAGTERAPWTEEDESALQAHAKEAVSGVTFWGLKRRG